MPRAKSNLSQQEVLLKRADASWRYRQRTLATSNRDAVNEKARLRMQRKRAAMKNASSAVQLEYRMRARKHRRDYRERVKRVGRKRVDKSSSRVNTNVVPLQRSRHSSATSDCPPTPPLPCPASPQSPQFSDDDDDYDDEYDREGEYDGEDEDDGGEDSDSEVYYGHRRELRQ
ncbi:hypothetical protein R3P38DRAFT_2779208 [Favolaschia claudopus]|uniref:Uncharacterized protein n=1 Tax=Favolaschia claudopus TaxID=2862362 RepID=A0AAW0BB75_9AGAR